jgi:Type II secretory pathway, component PulF
MPRFTGPVRVTLDKLPPWSIYRIVNGAGFLLSMGALVAAGVQSARALEKLRKNASPWLKERLDATLKHVYSGSNVGRAMQRAGYSFPDEEIIEDLCAYADLPAFTEMLETLGKEWMSESVELISAQARVLNTIALMAMAGVVAWIFSGMFDIQQQITSSVQGGI